MKKISVCLLLLLVTFSLGAQPFYKKPVKPTKNVIVMIPDGTSTGVLTATRWFKTYNNMGETLALDPYMCGTVITYCSDAPIGDSAPTTSCYMTGMPQQAGNVAIYPVSNPGNDIVYVDPEKAYQPLTTLLEAAKYEQNKATGLVVTCHFPHATPADCSSHHYNRSKTKYIASQMAYQNLDVMFGGGNKYITDDIRSHFASTKTKLIQDDIEAFRKFNGKEKIWALFSEKEQPYDIDRDDNKTPSLSEMTEKALDRLSKNKNGFFLMVEGSKVDFAAHSNDAIGCIGEMLAFDKAVKAVLDFAEKNGETTVVILPDHGTGGFTIGRYGLQNYSRLSLEQLFGKVSKFKKTSGGLEDILIKADSSQFRSIFKQYTDIDITDDEVKLLLSSKNYKEGDYMKISNSVNMQSSIVKIMNARTPFGFSTGGHTGDEVFLAAYHPDKDLPIGVNTNIEVNQYLFDALGLPRPLTEITDEIFSKHTEVFKGMNYAIDKSGDFPVLTVKKGNKTLSVPAFKSVAYLNGKPITLKSVTVYIDKNETFYLPLSLAKQL